MYRLTYTKNSKSSAVLKTCDPETHLAINGGIHHDHTACEVREMEERNCAEPMENSVELSLAANQQVEKRICSNSDRKYLSLVVQEIVVSAILTPRR